MWLWWVRIPSGDLTGVTLVCDHTFWRVDWCDSGVWGYLLETWLVWLWWVMIPTEDLTDVTLVSEDAILRLHWCDSGKWGCLVVTFLMWLWWMTNITSSASCDAKKTFTTSLRMPFQVNLKDCCTIERERDCRQSNEVPLAANVCRQKPFSVALTTLYLLHCWEWKWMRMPLM